MMGLMKQAQKMKKDMKKIKKDISKTNLTFHVQHLIVHGILHLLGYDHASDSDATLMEDLERQILGNLGVNAHTQL